jgi:hypothetical protein
MDTDALARRVADQTQNDASLINTAAVDIARALNLEGNNRTLGRKFVRMAVSSTSFDDFKDSSKEYAALPVSLQQKIYDSTKQKAASIMAQLQQGKREQEQEQERGVATQSAGSFSGFSGTNDRLETTENITRGGLVKSDKHVFSRPDGGMSAPPREKKTSALGLDKLAKLKQVSMAAAKSQHQGEEEEEEEVRRGRAGSGSEEEEEALCGSFSKGGSCMHVHYCMTYVLPLSPSKSSCAMTLLVTFPQTILFILFMNILNLLLSCSPRQAREASVPV